MHQLTQKFLSVFLMIMAGIGLSGGLTSAQAQTFPVTLDPQSFLGSYNVRTVSPSNVVGLQVYNLAPGSYNLWIG